MLTEDLPPELLKRAHDAAQLVTEAEQLRDHALHDRQEALRALRAQSASWAQIARAGQVSRSRAAKIVDGNAPPLTKRETAQEKQERLALEQERERAQSMRVVPWGPVDL